MCIISAPEGVDQEALNILADELDYAYNNADTDEEVFSDAFSKTAERIILELREKVAEEARQTPVTVAGMTKDMADAVAILCSLGKNASEAEKLVEAASKLGAVTAQELINMAFRIN